MIRLSVNDAKRLIRNFGPFMTKFSIRRCYFDYDEDPATLVPLLDRYCNALKSLHLFGMDMMPATIDQCHRLFSNLRRLEIFYWNNEETLECCLAVCVSIKELEIVGLKEMEGKFLARRFEALESLRMISCDFSFDYVNKFFAKNLQQKKVEITNSYFARTDLVLELPNLESLVLGYGFLPNITSVPRMASTLRKLKICLDDVKHDIIDQLLTNLAAYNNVQELHLSNASLTDELIRSLSELKTLKFLSFWTCLLDGKQCKKLACELTVLSEIRVRYCDGITFDEIKEFVAHSTHLQRLVYSRCHNSRPSLTKEMCWSLVDARRASRGKDTLFIYLDGSDLDVLRNEYKRNGMLIEEANVIKFLPLDEEQKEYFY